MSGKALVTMAGTASLLIAGCAGTHQSVPPPPPVAVGASLPSPKPAVTTKSLEGKSRPPLRTSLAKPQPKPKPATEELTSSIRGDCTWVAPARSLVVKKAGTPDSPQQVPLFRQAIVLAKVRAALAGTPAAPRAEFHQGTLTLTFNRGSSAEIAAAANRALSTQEVDVMRLELVQ